MVFFNSIFWICSFLVSVFVYFSLNLIYYLDFTFFFYFIIDLFNFELESNFAKFVQELKSENFFKITVLLLTILIHYFFVFFNTFVISFFYDSYLYFLILLRDFVSTDFFAFFYSFYYYGYVKHFCQEHPSILEIKAFFFVIQSLFFSFPFYLGLVKSCISFFLLDLIPVVYLISLFFVSIWQFIITFLPQEGFYLYLIPIHFDSKHLFLEWPVSLFKFIYLFIYFIYFYISIIWISFFSAFVDLFILLGKIFGINFTLPMRILSICEYRFRGEADLFLVTYSRVYSERMSYLPRLKLRFERAFRYNSYSHNILPNYFHLGRVRDSYLRYLYWRGTCRGAYPAGQYHYDASWGLRYCYYLDSLFTQGVDYDLRGWLPIIGRYVGFPGDFDDFSKDWYKYYPAKVLPEAFNYGFLFWDYEAKSSSGLSQPWSNLKWTFIDPLPVRPIRLNAGTVRAYYMYTRYSINTEGRFCSTFLDCSIPPYLPYLQLDLVLALFCEFVHYFVPLNWVWAGLLALQNPDFIDSFWFYCYFKLVLGLFYLLDLFYSDWLFQWCLAYWSDSKAELYMWYYPELYDEAVHYVNVAQEYLTSGWELTSEEADAFFEYLGNEGFYLVGDPRGYFTPYLLEEMASQRFTTRTKDRWKDIFGTIASYVSSETPLDDFSPERFVYKRGLPLKTPLIDLTLYVEDPDKKVDPDEVVVVAGTESRYVLGRYYSYYYPTLYEKEPFTTRESLPLYVDQAKLFSPYYSWLGLSAKEPKFAVGNNPYISGEPISGPKEFYIWSDYLDLLKDWASLILTHFWSSYFFFILCFFYPIFVVVCFVLYSLCWVSLSYCFVLGLCFSLFSLLNFFSSIFSFFSFIFNYKFFK